ncbi:MAG: PAS domain-containing hybrid sensor histidine kinase/response regulator [Acidimicrobiales bacterium]
MNVGRPGDWKARYRDDWTLRQKGLAALALPIVILLGVALGLSVLSAARSHSLAAEGNALVVERDATVVEEQSVVAVSAEHGVLVAPAPVPDAASSGTFAAPSSQEAATASALRHSLSTLAEAVAVLGQDAACRTALEQVRAAVDDELTLLAAHEASSPSPPTTPGQVVGSGQVVGARTTQALSRVQTAVGALLAAAMSRRDAAAAAGARAGTWLVIVLSVGGSLGLAGTVAAVSATNRSIARRADRLRRAVDRIERGEPLGDLPAGSDELGWVAAGLSRAAFLVEDQRQVLQQHRSFMEALLEHSPVVAWRVDLDTGAVAYVSPNCADLMGLTVEDATRSYQAVTDRLDEEDLTVVRATVERIRQTGSRATFGVRYHHPDGRPRSFRIDLLPVGPQPDGSNALCFYTDVTEVRAARERLLEQKNLLEAVLEASPDIYVVRDLELRVIDVHGAVRRLLGWEPHEYALRAEHVDVLGVEDRARFLDTLTSVGAGRSGVAELRFEVTDSEGGRHVFDMLVSPVRDHEGRIIGTLTASRDITARLVLEAELVRARVDAERANQAKSEFLSRMSHELRTPLNAILGFTQLLELDELPEEQADQLAHIRRAGAHLLALINEVLDVTRIEAGRLELAPEPVELASAVAEVVELLAPLSSARHLCVSVAVADGLPPVLADRTRLAQVLVNLVTNAVKYNRDGGTVTIEASLVEPGPTGAAVRIAVTDTGAGIAPQLMDRLFVPFDRLGAEQTGIEGTGMGLALTQALTGAMGGTIEVSSEPGAGSTFAVTFPATTRVPATTRPAPVVTPPSPSDRERVAGADKIRPVTVLYIEDNASNVELMAEVLRRHGGAHLLVAGDGQTGLALAARHRPDLVLLDLHLPDLTGEEVLHRLQSSAATVVAVSADATRAQIDRVLALGAATYVTKPFDVSVIGRLVDGCRTNDQGAAAD